MTQALFRLWVEQLLFLTLVWLVAIATVPWNIYFQARGILAEAEESRKREIHIDEEKIAYTKRWSDRALLTGVLLHITTAAGMYFLASAGVSFIGYFGAGAALALTVVRPITRLYAYVRQRLVTIGEEIAYPRHDVVSLKFTVENLTVRVKALEEKLDADNEYSWAAERARGNSPTRQIRVSAPPFGFAGRNQQTRSRANIARRAERNGKRHGRSRNRKPRARDYSLFQGRLRKKRRLYTARARNA
jgi:hypothetical protein